jgi:hypothetical protein
MKTNLVHFKIPINDFSENLLEHYVVSINKSIVEMRRGYLKKLLHQFIYHLYLRVIKEYCCTIKHHKDSLEMFAILRASMISA